MIVKKFSNCSFKSKYSCLVKFFNNLSKFKKLKTIKQKAGKKKASAYSELYNNLLGIYYNEYNELSDAQRRKLDDNYDPKNLIPKGYDYSFRSENEEESTDDEESTVNEESTEKEKSDDKIESVELSVMQLLEGNEEKGREGKGMKILTPNKLLTRLPILLIQITARNNSYKLKNKIR